MDFEKYRAIFLEEASEHLAELARALLALEKEPGDVDAIDTAFRMAHSIKGMAASLEYEAIADVAHGLEDRMDVYRTSGRIDDEAIGGLFQGLEELERMVEELGRTGQASVARKGSQEITDSGSERRREPGVESKASPKKTSGRR